MKERKVIDRKGEKERKIPWENIVSLAAMRQSRGFECVHGRGERSSLNVCPQTKRTYGNDDDDYKTL